MVIEEREFVFDVDAFHQSNVGNIGGLNNTFTFLLTADSGIALKTSWRGGYTPVARTNLMELLMRIVVGTLLVFFATFCSYGFLASFEFPGITSWKVGYALLAVTSLYGGYKLIRSGVQLLK
mgnify:FL=1